MAETIRFAPLIRVSTEKQEEQGSSLETQKEAILKAIATIEGGDVPDHCWIYTGQEHATPDYERQMFSQLLSDAGKDLFDAVIVYDPSRWSRDNRLSKEGLNILKENGIRFFCGATEYNLFDPQATLFLGMSTEMNEYFALEQARKSLLSRIARAKNNIPSAGKPPYGRTYDRKKHEWGIDTEKQRKIVWAADQYLNGKSMSEIAKTLGMNHPNLWKILKNRSGAEWVIEFDNKRLNISETVILSIPPLLPQETIDAIWRKSESNKTYEHGNIKNKYLFSRMIFCARCGYAMFGQTNHGKRRYYRHARGRKKECDIGLWISADEIEQAVFVKLYSLYGDHLSIEKAINRSVDKYGDAEKIREEIVLFRKDLKSIETELTNLVKAVAKGVLKQEDIKKRDKLQVRQDKIEKEIAISEKKIENVPSPEKIKAQGNFIQKVLEKATKNRLGRGDHFLKMTWEERRNLCEFFSLALHLMVTEQGYMLQRIT